MSGWLPIVAAAGLVAVLELDGVQVGQFMLSRPIVLGGLLGLLFGAPQTGVALGLCLELLSIDDLPVGDRLPLNAPVAAAAAFLFTRTPSPLPVAAALPAGLAAGWLHQRLESWLRVRRQCLCGEAEACVREGGLPSWGGLMGRSLAGQAGGTFLLLVLGLCAAGPALRALCLRAPSAVVEGFGFGLTVAPWLALGVAVHALWRRPA